MKFTLEIELGNDAMRTSEDVAEFWPVADLEQLILATERGQ